MGIHLDKKLKKGQVLDLAFYLQGSQKPLSMQGEVSWFKVSPDPGFDAGIKLITIEGMRVHDTVYFDEEHQVYWSEVLEMITNVQKVIAQEGNNKQN